jgi:hypothetical protein
MLIILEIAKFVPKNLLEVFAFKFQIIQGILKLKKKKAEEKMQSFFIEFIKCCKQNLAKVNLYVTYHFEIYSTDCQISYKLDPSWNPPDFVVHRSHMIFNRVLVS